MNNYLFHRQYVKENNQKLSVNTFEQLNTNLDDMIKELK